MLLLLMLAGRLQRGMWLKCGCCKCERTISDVDIEQTSSYLNHHIEPTNEVLTSKVSNINSNVNSVLTTVSSRSKLESITVNICI